VLLLRSIHSLLHWTPLLRLRRKAMAWASNLSLCLSCGVPLGIGRDPARHHLKKTIGEQKQHTPRQICKCCYWFSSNLGWLTSAALPQGGRGCFPKAIFKFNIKCFGYQ